MKTFDYSFLKNYGFTSNILAAYISIEKIQGIGIKNREIYPKVFENMQKISNAQSIEFTHKLDGIITSSRLTKSIKDNNIKSSNNTENEIINYRDVLLDVHSNYDNLKFSENMIKDIHQCIFSDSNSGYYKDLHTMLMETLDDGTKRVIFNPTNCSDTPSAMENLIIAYNAAIDDNEIPKLLLIPCVILDFLLIHPFNDGNERISRLLSLLLLYKNNYTAGKFVSLEKQIYKSKSDYYEAIRLSSTYWSDNQNNYNPFILYFLEKLYLNNIEINSRFNIVNYKRKNKKIRIEETIMKSWNPISRSEIYLVWPDISHETIKKVIKNLLNENKIKKIGNYKDAKYKKNWYGKPNHSDENMVIF